MLNKSAVNGAVNSPPHAPEIAALITRSESARRTSRRETANAAIPAAAMPVGTSGPRLNPAMSDTTAIATPPGIASLWIRPVARATKTLSSCALGTNVWMIPTTSPPSVRAITILIDPENALGSSGSGHNTLWPAETTATNASATTAPAAPIIAAIANARGSETGSAAG